MKPTSVQSFISSFCMKSAEICRRKKGRFMNPFLEPQDQLQYNTNSCGVSSSNPMKSDLDNFSLRLSLKAFMILSLNFKTLVSHQSWSKSDLVLEFFYTQTVAFIAGKSENPAAQNFFIRFSIDNLIANISFYVLSWPKLNFGCYLTFEIIF